MFEDANLTPEPPGDFILSTSAQYIFASFLILTSVTGIAGNSLVILSVFLSAKLQTKTNVFVVTLAFCDLLTCASIPFDVVSLVTPIGQPMPDRICTGHGMFMVFCHIYKYHNPVDDFITKMCQGYQTTNPL